VAAFGNRVGRYIASTSLALRFVLTAVAGYWMPFDCARAVCTTFCYRIATALIPIFGPSFPADCVPLNHTEPANMRIDESIVLKSARKAETFRQIYMTRFLASKKGSEKPDAARKELAAISAVEDAHLKASRNKAYRGHAEAAYHVLDRSRAQCSPPTRLDRSQTSTPPAAPSRGWTAINPPLPPLSSLPGMQKYRHKLTPSSPASDPTRSAAMHAGPLAPHQRQQRTPLPGLDIFHHRPQHQDHRPQPQGHQHQQRQQLSGYDSPPQQSASRSQAVREEPGGRKRNADQISRDDVRIEPRRYDSAPPSPSDFGEGPSKADQQMASQPQEGDSTQRRRLTIEQQAAAALLIDLSIGKTHATVAEPSSNPAGATASDSHPPSKKTQSDQLLKEDMMEGGNKNVSDAGTQAFKKRRTRSLDCLP
jgi:hypothetical protein